MTIPFNIRLDLPVVIVYFGVFISSSCTSPFTTEFVVRFMDGVIQHVLRCIQDKECMVVGHRCDGMTSEYTIDDYCPMLITLGACTAALEHTLHCLRRRHIVANAIDACSSVAVRKIL
jgi:hypothetical protein